MKTRKTILLILIVPIFCFGTCKQNIEQDFVIQNNSDQEIIVDGGYLPIDDAPDCLKPPTSFEYKELIKSLSIPINSSKNFTGIGNGLMSKPNDTIYIYIYHRIDMDTMSCDEFKAKFPVQKRYSITKADAEAMSWRLVYP